MLFKRTNYFHVHLFGMMYDILINIAKSYTVNKRFFSKLHTRSTYISFSSDLFRMLSFIFIKYHVFFPYKYNI